MNYSQAIQKMADTITAQIHNMIKSKSYSDKTFTAKVTEIVNTSKCRVLYCGNTFTVSTTIPVEIGNIVRVCAPCNNWKDLYIVENKTAGKTLDDMVSKINRDLVKQVRTPPVRPADGVAGCVYESFVPEEDCRGLGLRAKIKAAEHTPAL